MGIEDNGGTAFPSQAGYDFKGERVTTTNDGMTLRDYFAAKMMPFQLSKEMMPYRDYNYSNAAIRAYAMADAMLEARKK